MRSCLSTKEAPLLMGIYNGCSRTHCGGRQQLAGLSAADKMQDQPEAAAHALVADLKSCSMRRDLEWGRRIHAKAVETGNHSNVYVVAALIKMYGKCGRMVEARHVFESSKQPDVVVWNTLLLGYAENEEGLAALELLPRMKAHGCEPSSATYVAALKACTSLAVKGDDGGKADCLQRGRQIHSEIGCQLHLYVQNTLIDMYAKCGSMVEARRVFDSIAQPSVVSWNALILGYAENGQGLSALEMFSRMKAHGSEPSSITYIGALKSCTSLAAEGDGSRKSDALQRGRQIHSEIGCYMDFYVQNTLIDMYAKCGSMVDARNVFNNIKQPNVVSWSALLIGYAENGEGLAALDLFSRMKTCGCVPNSVTYIGALKACISLAADSRKADCLEWGRQIHLEIGCSLDPYVQTTLIDMYGKCGSMEDARHVFENIKQANVVSWNALLKGYAENGEGLVVLELFSKMKAHGCAPSSATYVPVLKACASLAVEGDGSAKGDWLERGRQIHSEIGCHLDHYVQSALIDMYAKCGSMLDARHVFDNIKQPDVVSWTALLVGYAENGDGVAALQVFSRMKANGCEPDYVSYIGALKACALLRALPLGRKVHSEIRVFTSNLVSCLVDFYAKCGSMVEAQEVFDLHPTARSLETWNALLAGYSSFGDIDSVIKLFEAFQDAGFRPDAVTFLSLLLCCSHSGLVEKAREYFEAMLKHGLTPTVMHYTCMVDVLGRANQVNEAIVLLSRMPCKPDAVIWRALLGACRKWKNVEVGRLAFQSLVDMNKKDSSACLLMAQLYGSSGVEEEQETVDKSFESLIANSSLREEQETGDKSFGSRMATSSMREERETGDKSSGSIMVSSSMREEQDNGDKSFGSLVASSGMREERETGDKSFGSLMAFDGAGPETVNGQLKLGMRTSGARKQLGQAYVAGEEGQMVTFVVGKPYPPEVDERLEQLHQAMKEHGYVAEASSTSEGLCGHSERRAVAYGLMKTAPDEQVRVFKDIRMCDDCHDWSKVISKLSGRVILVRDESRFHVMKNGSCSCRDYW